MSVYCRGRLPGTSLCVDYFSGLAHDEFSNDPLSRSCDLIYFLTHAHTDHTYGLTPSWNFGPLFCSAATRSLLLCKFPDFDCSRLQALEFHKPTKIPLDRAATEFVTVTLFDAGNHCIGACMFLFEGFFGRILYTGDIRYDRTMEKEMRNNAALINKTIDVLYLDNTFNHPRYTGFLSRTGCVEAILSVIRAHPGCDLVINSDLLGKEDIFVYLAHALQCLIVVPEKRMRILKCLFDAGISLPSAFEEELASKENSNKTEQPKLGKTENPEDSHADRISLDPAVLIHPGWFSVFTGDPSRSFVRVFAKQHLSKANLAWMNNPDNGYQENQRDRPVIGILMSGWAIDQKEKIVQFAHQAPRTDVERRYAENLVVGGVRIRERFEAAQTFMRTKTFHALSENPQLQAATEFLSIQQIERSRSEGNSPVEEGAEAAEPPAAIVSHPLAAVSPCHYCVSSTFGAVGAPCLIHFLPYSSHSSHPELLNFVAAVRPREIRPIVAKHTNFQAFQQFLEDSPRAPVIVPASLLQATVPRSIKAFNPDEAGTEALTAAVEARIENRQSLIDELRCAGKRRGFRLNSPSQPVKKTRSEPEIVVIEEQTEEAEESEIPSLAAVFEEEKRARAERARLADERNLADRKAREAAQFQQWPRPDVNARHKPECTAESCKRAKYIKLLALSDFSVLSVEKRSAEKTREILDVPAFIHQAVRRCIMPLIREKEDARDISQTFPSLRQSSPLRASSSPLLKKENDFSSEPSNPSARPLPGFIKSAAPNKSRPRQSSFPPLDLVCVAPSGVSLVLDKAEMAAEVAVLTGEGRRRANKKSAETGEKITNNEETEKENAKHEESPIVMSGRYLNLKYGQGPLPPVQPREPTEPLMFKQTKIPDLVQKTQRMISEEASVPTTAEPPSLDFSRNSTSFSASIPVASRERFSSSLALTDAALSFLGGSKKSAKDKMTKMEQKPA